MNLLPILPRSLRKRDWFWTSAARCGFDWLLHVSSHRITSLAFNAIALGGLVGVAVVFHPDTLVAVCAGAIITVLIVGKGARLKWKAASDAARDLEDRRDRLQERLEAEREQWRAAARDKENRFEWYKNRVRQQRELIDTRFMLLEQVMAASAAVERGDVKWEAHRDWAMSQTESMPRRAAEIDSKLAAQLAGIKRESGDLEETNATLRRFASFMQLTIDDPHFFDYPG